MNLLSTLVCHSFQEGLGNLSLKGTESTVLAAIVLLIVAGLFGTAAIAALSKEQWITYSHLFDESRLVRYAKQLWAAEGCKTIDDDKNSLRFEKLICLVSPYQEHWMSLVAWALRQGFSLMAASMCLIICPFYKLFKGSDRKPATSNAGLWVQQN